MPAKKWVMSWDGSIVFANGDWLNGLPSSPAGSRVKIVGVGDRYGAIGNTDFPTTVVLRSARRRTAWIASSM